MKKADPEIARREELVATRSGGIEPMFEAFYLQSIIYAAGRASEAFRRYDEAVDREESDAVIVATVHEALTHAAGLSRFFWPARTAGILGAARGAKLLAGFGLDEQSPLYDRALRNALEHHDERLDRFLLQDVVGHFFPGPLVGSAELADDQLGHIFRLVDPREEVFVLLGEKHPFGTLRQSVEGVLESAVQMDNEGGRLPFNG